MGEREIASKRPDGTQRTRGKRAGLNISQIVEAAGCLPPNQLTMQLLAERIGVDRKALTYHVTDRASLLTLVAAEAFVKEFAGFSFDPRAGWQDAVRIYANGMADSLIATGELVQYFEIGRTVIPAFLDPSDKLLGKFIDSGLDSQTGARLLMLLTNIVILYARDVVAAASGERVLANGMRQAIEGHGSFLLHLPSVLEGGLDLGDRVQLDIGIQLVIDGIEGLITRNPR